MATEHKNKNSSRGAQIDCINFEMCPLCYGCRNYDSLDTNCAKCLENAKQNLCNTKTHKAHLVSKMITKQEIKL